MIILPRVISKLKKYIFSRGGHAKLFFRSAIAIAQLEGCTSAIAIPQLFKELLIRNCNSAITIFLYLQVQVRKLSWLFRNFFNTIVRNCRSNIVIFIAGLIIVTVLQRKWSVNAFTVYRQSWAHYC